MDGSGDIYVADSANNQILKETLFAGTYSQSIVISGLQSGLTSIAVDQAGNLYYTDNHDHSAFKLSLVSGSYQQSAVGFTGPNVIASAVAVDQFGDVPVVGTDRPIGAGTVGAAFLETPVNGNYEQSSLNIGWMLPAAVAVDPEGDFYITGVNVGGGGEILEESPLHINDFGTVSIGATNPVTSTTFTP